MPSPAVGAEQSLNVTAQARPAPYLKPPVAYSHLQNRSESVQMNKLFKESFMAAVAVSAAVVIAASGCSLVKLPLGETSKTPPNGTSTPSAPTRGSTPTESQPNAPGGPANSPTPQGHVTSGILTVDTSKGNYERTYGFIDPTSGQYSEVAKFNLPQSSQGVPHPNLAASPDLTKFAIVETVDGQQHAGWIDTQGTFTSVTPAASPGAFGGVPPTYNVIGFDGKGNFYYRENSQGAIYTQTFELAAGSTTNPQEITSKAARDESAGLYLNYDGTLQFGCNFHYSWLGPTTEVFVAGGATQIDKREYTDTDTAGCPGHGHDTPLLPASNVAHLADAVGNRDGTMVAFKYDARDAPNQGTFVNGSYLYTVSADGSAQPKKVNLANLTPEQLAFKTLLSWQ